MVFDIAKHCQPNDSFVQCCMWAGSAGSVVSYFGHRRGQRSRTHSCPVWEVFFKHVVWHQTCSVLRHLAYPELPMLSTDKLLCMFWWLTHIPVRLSYIVIYCYRIVFTYLIHLNWVSSFQHDHFYSYVSFPFQVAARSPHSGSADHQTHLQRGPLLPECNAIFLKQIKTIWWRQAVMLHN